jgi:hypothetical protein
VSVLAPDRGLSSRAYPLALVVERHRTEYQKSVADYRTCLDAHPWELKACDGERLAMEAEKPAYNNLSVGPTNVTLQSR